MNLINGQDLHFINAAWLWHTPKSFVSFVSSYLVLYKKFLNKWKLQQNQLADCLMTWKWARVWKVYVLVQISCKTLYSLVKCISLWYWLLQFNWNYVIDPCMCYSLISQSGNPRIVFKKAWIRPSRIKKYGSTFKVRIGWVQNGVCCT